MQAQSLNGGASHFQQSYLASIDPLVVDELLRRLDGTLKG